MSAFTFGAVYGSWKLSSYKARAPLCCACPSVAYFRVLLQAGSFGREWSKHVCVLRRKRQL